VARDESKKFEVAPKLMSADTGSERPGRRREIRKETSECKVRAELIPQKHTPVSRKPTVEDVTDSELESDFDFKDSEVESEEEMESDGEDITLEEIQSDAELLEFALRLQEAHDQMVTEEKSKWAANKRKSTYLGNLDRSKQRWKLQGKRAEEAGFPSVTKFFLKQTEVPEAPSTLGFEAEVSQTKYGNVTQ